MKRNLKSISQIALAILATTAANYGIANTIEDCKSGKSGQYPQACMMEIRNAKQEQRSSKSLSEDESYKNQTSRCEIFQGEEKAQCHARVQYGNIHGSVKNGGTLTELTTTVPSN